MAAVARWCFRHRFVVLLLWLGGVVGVGVINAAVGTGYNDNFTLPGAESSKALDLLRSAFPTQAGESDTIVWRADHSSVSDPAVRDQMTAMLDQVAHAPRVSGVTSPYTREGAAQISADGRTAYAEIHLSGTNQIPAEDARRIIDIGQSARTDGLQVELGGNSIRQANQVSTNATELVGIVAAAVVLLLAFGSLLAMLLPLVTAIVSLVAATMSIGLISNAMSMATLAPTIATLIGLGVGIDYALFVVTRYRNGLQAGLGAEEAAVRALNTSGRAVIFAGLTVCVAMLGLFVVGINFLNGIGVSAAVMVLFNVLAAVTLLPALLGVMKLRVLSRRERRRLATEGPQDVHATGFWARWAGVVQRHPRPLAAGALIVMLLLVVPVLSLRLGSSDQGNDPSGTTTRRAYDLLSNGFGPGFNGPLQLVAETRTPADQQAVRELATTVAHTPGVATAQALPAQPDARLSIVQVIPTTSPQDVKTSDLIKRLRTEVIPAAEQGTTMRAYVGGQTAIFDDFADVLASKVPLFIAVIVGLGFVLLFVAFRSIVVPLTAAVMNLLAAGASFGIVVAVFQWGWGSEGLGLGRDGPVEAFLPAFMLAILFGLSMDYQVFLVSQMHEEWVHTRDNRRAIMVGQTATGRVVTAAATIMICVFVAFVFGGQRIIAEFGIGLASAVFLDAFILRLVLVPAVMHMFGAGNWWLPRWIDSWMPHLSVEPADEPAAQPEPLAAAVTAPVLHGRVVDAHGEGLAGSALTLVSQAGSEQGRTLTRTDGHYRLPPAPPGTYVIVAAAAGHQSQAAKVVLGDESVAHEMVLTTAAGRLSGRVVETVRELPVKHATVTVTDARGNIADSAKTDAMGRYGSAKLPVGEFTLTVTATGFRPTALAARVTSGSPVLDVHLQPSVRLQGVVRAVDGDRPLADARVTLVDDAGNTVASTLTGEDGRYSFTDLAPGEYSLIANGYPPSTTLVTMDGHSLGDADVMLARP